jgi:hypothetical protein
MPPRPIALMLWNGHCWLGGSVRSSPGIRAAEHVTLGSIRHGNFGACSSEGTRRVRNEHNFSPVVVTCDGSGLQGFKRTRAVLDGLLPFAFELPTRPVSVMIQ